MDVRVIHAVLSGDRGLRSIGLLSLAVFVVACGGGTATLQAPGGAQPGALPSQVAVRVFSMDAAEVKSYQGPTDFMGRQVADTIANELRRLGHSAEVIDAGDPAPDGVDAVVDGRVTLVDGGSRALRYWIGFGAGGAWFAVEGDVVDASGAPLAEFSRGRKASGGVFGGNDVGMVSRCINVVSIDVARALHKGAR